MALETTLPHKVVTQTVKATPTRITGLKPDIQRLFRWNVSLRFDWRLLWPAWLNVWRGVCFAAKWMFIAYLAVVTVWVLVNLATLLNHWHWYAVGREAQIEVCREYARMRGVEPRWSDQVGCH